MRKMKTKQKKVLVGIFILKVQCALRVMSIGHVFATSTL